MFQIETKTLYRVLQYIDESDGNWEKSSLYAFQVLAWVQHVDSDGLSLIPCCACADGMVRPDHFDPDIFEFVGFFESLPEGTNEVTYENQIL